MRNLHDLLRLYIYLEIIVKGSALKCWKCIAHDCDQDPEDNYNAAKVTCTDGTHCMKVQYRMFDNITHYDSVVRTCSSGQCQATPPKEFLRCLDTPKQYMISGCALRLCCTDRDLCNSSFNIRSPLSLFIFITMKTLFYSMPNFVARLYI